MKKTYVKILAASKATAIPWVAKNLPVVQEGHIMTADMMDNLEAALTASETAASELATIRTSLESAEAAKLKAEGDLATANARIKELEKDDSKTPSTPDAKDEVTHLVVTDANTMDFQKELYSKL